MKNKTIISIIIVLIVVGGAGYLLYKANKAPGRYDQFAQCLEEKEVTFYGAFWCSHCQNQKAMFGKSKKLLPYVECSTANGKEQLSVCNDVGVKTYPTWDFPDGTRLIGEQPLAVLSEKTGCPLPQ